MVHGARCGVGNPHGKEERDTQRHEAGHTGQTDQEATGMAHPSIWKMEVARRPGRAGHAVLSQPKHEKPAGSIHVSSRQMKQGQAAASQPDWKLWCVVTEHAPGDNIRPGAKREGWKQTPSMLIKHQPYSRE